MLNEDMFKKRVPNSGDILYQALQNLIPKVTYNSTNYQLDCKYFIISKRRERKKKTLENKKTNFKIASLRII